MIDLDRCRGWRAHPDLLRNGYRLRTRRESPTIVSLRNEWIHRDSPGLAVAVPYVRLPPDRRWRHTPFRHHEIVVQILGTLGIAVFANDIVNMDCL